jgi:multicomponent Na+:H+ antiporter subunit D
MNWNALLPLLLVLSSLIPGLAIFFLREEARRARIFLNMGGALLKTALMLLMLLGVYGGEEYEFRIPFMLDYDLVLHGDAMSVLFASLSTILWLVTTVYAIGYLEESPNRSRFFGFFSLCVSATIGIALAGNMITFVVFYELLTLTTYPLVVHRGTPEALRAGKIYLIYTLVSGTVLLVGVLWLRTLAGPLDFTAAGLLKDLDAAHHQALIIIFWMLIVGLGVKAALVPLHGWLPMAMVAPAPVSALLHAVAVVKAGAFGIIRVVYDVYGIEFAAGLGVLGGLAALAGITIIYASLRALFQDDLKRRLAYSTISQVSYITLGVAIFGPLATIGGVVHLVHQGMMKITLFFCAGNLAETLHIHRVSEMAGVGRRMPWTMAAFTIGALGMIGLPPLAGFVSKWYLGLGAVEREMSWVLWVLVGSSALNAAYFLPVLYTAWFRQPDGQWKDEYPNGVLETSWMLLLPPCFTAMMVVLVGLFAASMYSPLNWAQVIAAREYLQ